TMLVREASPAPGEPDRVQREFDALPLDELFAPGSPARAGLSPDPAQLDGALRRVLARIVPCAERFVHEWDDRTAGGAFPVEAVMPLPMAVVFRDGIELLLGRRTVAARFVADPVLSAALVRAVLQRVHGQELECDARASAGFARAALTLLATVACARA